METKNLKELCELRNTIKAAEARIDQISDKATEEAVAILAKEGLDRGEFIVDGHTYQLQRTDVIDMSKYNRYKGEDAVHWRAHKAEQNQLRKLASALTKKMKSIIDAFSDTHPDWVPDEVKLTVKCLD